MRRARLPLPLLLLLLLVLLLVGAPCSKAHERPALQLLRPNDERNRTGLAVVESALAYIEALEVSVIVGGPSFIHNPTAKNEKKLAGSGTKPSTLWRSFP